MINETNYRRITNGLVEAMQLNGLDTIYGMAGIPVTDLVRQAPARGMRQIGFCHEQSAGSAPRMEIGGFNV
jgi:thiamine pyrophosphate-dependent acetolactate synthase large subunit-like protein